MTWKDSSTAQRFRDTVERIVKSVLTVERPETFTGRVDSYDLFKRIGTCRTLGMADDEPSIPFYCTGALFPFTSPIGLPINCVVEIEGRPGAYRMKRILSGDYQMAYPRLENPKVMGGNFGQIEVQSNFLIQFVQAHDIGSTTHAGSFTNAGKTLWSDGSYIVEFEINMELFGVMKKSYRVMVPQISTNEWQVLAPYMESGSQSGTDISLEMLCTPTGFEIRTRKLRTQNFNNSPISIAVKIQGEFFEYDDSKLNLIEPSARPTEYFGRQFHDNEEDFFNQTGLYASGVRHLIEARQHYNLALPAGGVSWDGTYLSWSQPFKVLGLGKGDMSSSGLMVINQPPAGTSIRVLGSANGYASSVTASGINMRFETEDMALYYEPKFLGDGSTDSGRFNLVGKTKAFKVPSHWILLAATNGPINGPGNSLFFGNGTSTDHWRSVTYQNGWSRYSPSYEDMSYRKIQEKIEMRGVASGGTIDATFFTLPVGFRPTYNRLLVCLPSNKVTGNTTAGGTSHSHTIGSVPTRLDVSTNGAVSSTLAGPSSTWCSIDGVSFDQY